MPTPPPALPVLMGIVNVTPDSFSDGGRYLDPGRAIEQGLQLWKEGAEILDVGGESTRPGADPVPEDEEQRRVLPVVAALVQAGAVVSVDTTRASTARRAIEQGATWINDVSALDDPEMAPVCAAAGVHVVLMHRRGTPKDMQRDTRYEDLIGEVATHLAARRDQALAAGIAASRIVLDPGVGFGKQPRDNPRLIAGVPRFRALGHRVLIGASRKRFIGDLSGVSQPEARVAGSIGAALAAYRVGADLLRVHDVAATRQALSVYAAIAQEEAWTS